MTCFRLITAIACLAFLLTGVPAQTRPVRIGTVCDGMSERFPRELERVKQEVLNITRGAHEVTFPESAQLSGDWHLTLLSQAIDRLLTSNKVDMVISLGEVATHMICRRKELPKPVIAANVIDAKTQDLPRDRGTSGKANLNYINTFSNIDRAFQSLLDIAPFDRVAVLADAFHIRSIPQLQALERRIANTFSLDMTMIPVTDQAGAALDKIPAETDAVFVSRLPRFSNAEFDRLVKGLIRRRLPSFAFSGRKDVEKGLLTSIIPQDHLQHMARSVAINVQEILDGTRAGQLKTAFPLSDKLSINMATARAIGVYPGWSILTEADLLHEADLSVGRRLNICQAVQEAIDANPDLSASRQTVRAGAEQVREAWSALLPQLRIGTDARIIDDDRAAASLGSAPEREWTGTVRATQLIYSDRVRANYDIEKQRQAAREQGRDAVLLDTVHAAATAYLDLLRAKSIEQIQKNNLKLTRENLERAQIRVSIGAAGPEEVFRWENQIAQSRRQVLAAESRTLNAVAMVNRVLNRPLSEAFAPAEEGAADPLSILPGQGILAYLDNPQELTVMQDFLVKEGLALSPEIKQLAAAIAAKERSILLARREFWLPSVSVFGDLTQSLANGGDGASPPAVLSRLSPGQSGADDTDWTCGITVSLPLYSGGGKSAFLRQNLEELSRLKYRYRATANAIEQGVLSAVYQIRASYPGIGLARHAADAARQNLTLVTDAYARGIKSIIDLIDAQSSALVADQQSANAAYDFLIDLMTAQRRVGRFYLFDPESDRKAFMERLDTYMADQGFSRERP